MGPRLDAHRDVTPLLLRLATALALLSVDGLLPGFPPVWPLALLLVVGLFSTTAAMLGVSAGLYILAHRPFDLLPYLVLFLCFVPVARRLRLLGPGRIAVDPIARFLPQRKPPKPKKKPNKAIAWLLGYYRDYPSFDLRLSAAFVMMPIGLYFALRPPPAMPWLGALWLALSVLLAVGLAVPWVSLACAAALALGWPATGSIAWLGVALVAAAASLAPDDRLTLDHWLATRRGGVSARDGRVAVLGEAPSGRLRQP